MKLLPQGILKEIARKQLKREWFKRISIKMIHKEVRNISIDIFRSLQGIMIISLGALSATFWLESFLLPNSFIDGWVTGISLIINELTTLPLSILLIIINAPFIAIGFFTVGKSFGIKSIFGIMLLAIFVQFVHLPVITDDKLLVSVFGWFFLGLGIGLAIRWGSVIDWTEVLALFINKKTAFSLWDVILVFNIIIFAFASYVFSLEIWLYGMLTYLVASKTVDYVVSWTQEYVGVTIISEYDREIQTMLLEKMNKGYTLYPAKSEYEKKWLWKSYNDVIFSIFTRLELSKLNTELEKIDSEVLIITQNIKDLKWEFKAWKHHKKIWH